ncbi:MAG: hypothetical protein AB8G18_09595 [Gammaproteobacteria bacterium]
MINEETLILYFYNDGLSPDKREQVRRALEGDKALRDLYAQLSDDINQIALPEGSLAPTGSIEGWRQSLDVTIDEERREQGYFRGSGRQAYALVAAAVLVFIAGWWFGEKQNSTTAPKLPQQVADVTSSEIFSRPASPKMPVVFVRGVSTHLERAQIKLASMDLDDSGERETLIEQIVSQNRSFLQAADKHGADDVARLLRAFEPLLLELSSDDESVEAKEKARDQLEFELRITLTKFARQASNRTNEF